MQTMLGPDGREYRIAIVGFGVIGDARTGAAMQVTHERPVFFEDPSTGIPIVAITHVYWDRHLSGFVEDETVTALRRSA
ncbi:MAG: hypothetical protein AAFQ84_08515 [Pseudomonadota bacterium]